MVYLIIIYIGASLSLYNAIQTWGVRQLLDSEACLKYQGTSDEELLIYQENLARGLNVLTYVLLFAMIMLGFISPIWSLTMTSFMVVFLNY